MVCYYEIISYKSWRAHVVVKCCKNKMMTPLWVTSELQKPLNYFLGDTSGQNHGIQSKNTSRLVRFVLAPKPLIIGYTACSSHFHALVIPRPYLYGPNNGCYTSQRACVTTGCCGNSTITPFGSLRGYKNPRTNISRVSMAATMEVGQRIHQD